MQKQKLNKSNEPTLKNQSSTGGSKSILENPFERAWRCYLSTLDLREPGDANSQL